MFFKRLIILVSFVFLTACSTGPVQPDVNSFSFEGLVGVNTPTLQQSANFKWREQAPAYQIEFYGPLGLGETYLDGDDQEAVLTLSSGKIYRADDPEGLLDQVLGWPLPVQGLNYWVFGKRAPGSGATITKNDQQQVTSLSQDGWEIDYTWAPGQNVPQKIILTRDDIRITIVINSAKGIHHWFH